MFQLRWCNHWRAGRQPEDHLSTSFKAREPERFGLHTTCIAHRGMLPAAQNVNAKRLVTPAPDAPERKREQVLRARDAAARLPRRA